MAFWCVNVVFNTCSLKLFRLLNPTGFYLSSSRQFKKRSALPFYTVWDVSVWRWKDLGSPLSSLLKHWELKLQVLPTNLQRKFAEFFIFLFHLEVALVALWRSRPDSVPNFTAYLVLQQGVSDGFLMKVVWKSLSWGHGVWSRRRISLLGSHATELLRGWLALPLENVTQAFLMRRHWREHLLE